MILTIFDFDDTLFPSSLLGEKILGSKRGLIDVGTASDLKKVAESIKSLLAEAVMCSDRVLVVTNANRSWINLCEKFTKCLGKITVVACQDFGLPDPNTEWKKIVFTGIAQRFLKEGDTLVAIGDRPDDREACLHIKQLLGIRTKSILVDKEPNLTKLLEEHRFLRSFLPAIATYDGDLDWMLYGEGPVKVNKIILEIDETLRGK